MWGILKIRLTVNPPLSKTCQITPRPAVEITPGTSAPKWHPKVVQKVALPDRPCQTGCLYVLESGAVAADAAAGCCCSCRCCCFCFCCCCCCYGYLISVLLLLLLPYKALLSPYPSSVLLLLLLPLLLLACCCCCCCWVVLLLLLLLLLQIPFEWGGDHESYKVLLRTL